MEWIKKEGAIEDGIVEGNRDFSSIALSGNLEFLKHYLLDPFFYSEAFKTGENGLVIKVAILNHSQRLMNKQTKRWAAC